MAMRNHRCLLLVLAAATLALGTAARAQRYVPTADPAFPRLMYTDSLESANDRCIVSQAKLNPKMAPMYVNGVPIGFC